MANITADQIAQIGNSIGFAQTGVADIEIAINDFKRNMPNLLASIRKSVMISNLVEPDLTRFYSSLQDFVGNIEAQKNIIKPKVNALLQAFLNDVTPAFNRLQADKSNLAASLSTIEQQIIVLQKLPPAKTQAEADLVASKIDQAIALMGQYQAAYDKCQQELIKCQEAMQAILNEIKRIQPSYQLKGLHGLQASPAISNFTTSIAGVQASLAQLYDRTAGYWNWFQGAANTNQNIWVDSISRMAARLTPAQLQQITAIITPSADAIRVLASGLLMTASAIKNHINNASNLYQSSMLSTYQSLLQEYDALQLKIDTKNQEIQRLNSQRAQAFNPKKYQELETKLQDLLTKHRDLKSKQQACANDILKCKSSITRLNSDLAIMKSNSGVTSASARLSPEPIATASSNSNQQASSINMPDQSAEITQAAQGNGQQGSQINTQSSDYLQPASRPDSNTNSSQLDASQYSTSTSSARQPVSPTGAKPRLTERQSITSQARQQCLPVSEYRKIISSISSINAEILQIQNDISTKCISDEQYRQAASMLRFLQNQKNQLSILQASAIKSIRK